MTHPTVYPTVYLSDAAYMAGGLGEKIRAIQLANAAEARAKAEEAKHRRHEAYAKRKAAQQAPDEAAGLA